MRTAAAGDLVSAAARAYGRRQGLSATGVEKDDLEGHDVLKFFVTFVFFVAFVVYDSGCAATSTASLSSSSTAVRIPPSDSNHESGSNPE